MSHITISAVPMRDMRLMLRNHVPSPDVEEGFIVISDPTDFMPPSKLPTTQSLDKLSVCFADEEDPDSFGAITEKDARDIALWFRLKRLAAEQADRDLSVIVSCKGGRCRSTAVAMVLQAEVEGDESAQNRFLLNNEFLPNTLVFDRLVKELWHKPTTPLPHDMKSWEEAFAVNRRRFDERELS